MTGVFHINGKGVPSPCRATKGNCPFGNEGTHFDTKSQAQEYIDKLNEVEYKLMPSVSDFEDEVSNNPRKQDAQKVSEAIYKDEKSISNLANSITELLGNNAYYQNVWTKYDDIGENFELSIKQTINTFSEEDFNKDKQFISKLSSIFNNALKSSEDHRFEAHNNYINEEFSNGLPSYSITDKEKSSNAIEDYQDNHNFRLDLEAKYEPANITNFMSSKRRRLKVSIDEALKQEEESLKLAIKLNPNFNINSKERGISYKEPIKIESDNRYVITKEMSEEVARLTHNYRRYNAKIANLRLYISDAETDYSKFRLSNILSSKRRDLKNEIRVNKVREFGIRKKAKINSYTLKEYQKTNKLYRQNVSDLKDVHEQLMVRYFEENPQELNQIKHHMKSMRKK